MRVCLSDDRQIHNDEANNGALDWYAYHLLIRQISLFRQNVMMTKKDEKREKNAQFLCRAIYVSTVLLCTVPRVRTHLP